MGNLGFFEILVNMVRLCFEIIRMYIIMDPSLLGLPCSYPENITPDSEVEPKTMTIGMNNVFEVGCGILFDSSENTWYDWRTLQVRLFHEYNYQTINPS